MTELIVDVFQMIRIDEHNRHWRLFRFAFFKKRLGEFIVSHTVIQSG